MNQRLKQAGRVGGKTAFWAADLPRVTQSYDVLVTGSDEIWKINGERAGDWSYFLDFAPTSARRLSYAASCGDRENFGELAGKARECLSRFDGISVRDRHTAQILRDEASVESTMVVDPAWFLDLNCASPGRQVEDPYLLLLGRLPPAALGFVRAFANREKIRVLSVGNYYDGADQLVSAPAPENWLALVRDAAHVVTSLYHGTIFALRYRRSVLTFCSTNKRYKLGELMESLGLAHRLISWDARQVSTGQIQDPVDFESIDTIINPRIAESKDWLVNHL
jgi:hypothetical protein